MRRSLILSLSLLAACASDAGRGSARSVSASKDDPQARYEPRSEPGVGQAFLAKCVGDFTVRKVFHPRTGDPVVTMGTCRQELMHSGRFLRSDFVFGEGEARTTGQGVIGFETENGKFTSVWTDSRSTRMSLRQSQDPFTGDQIVLWSQSIGATPASQPAREARRSRTVTRFEEGGRVLAHRQFSIAQDGSERLVMELLMTRKG